MNKHRPVLIAATLLAALLLPSAARANTYDVYSCWAGYGSFRNPNASAAAWVGQDASTSDYHAYDQCAGTTHNGFGVVSLGGYTASLGSGGSQTFSSPDGTSIIGVEFWRSGWTLGTDNAGSHQRNELVTLGDGAMPANGEVADGTRDVMQGQLGGTDDTTNNGVIPANHVSIDVSGTQPRTISYLVTCPFAGGCPTGHPDGFGGFAAGVRIFGTKVTINDTSSPALTVAGSGLFDGAPQSGVSHVFVSSATDNSGIKQLAVYADGALLAAIDYEQDIDVCSWWLARPCRDASEVEIPVDTAKLSDGNHAVVVRAFDAAGNERASETRTVAVANNGRTAGSAAAAGAKLRVEFARNHKTTIRSRFAKQVTITGELVDSTGMKLASAQIAYAALGSALGSTWRALGSVRTDAAGRFTLDVPSSLGSRRLRFTYGTQVTDLALNVVAPVSLKVGPRHVRNKQSVMFKGRVGAGPIPKRGKLVALQVQIGHRWTTFATLRSSRNGKFGYRYRFKRTFTRVTYRFRAFARHETRYPFASGRSKVRRVRVN